jgi:hypothetical protein
MLLRMLLMLLRNDVDPFAAAAAFGPPSGDTGVTGVVGTAGAASEEKERRCACGTSSLVFSLEIPLKENRFLAVGV